MFERFTESARRVVAAARSEAARMGHHAIGTEHLLLGLLGGHPAADKDVDPSEAGPVGNVLTTAGVGADYLRSDIIRLHGAGAGGLGDNEADALHSIGIDLNTVRSTLEDSFGAGVLDTPAGRHDQRLPLTRRAKRVLAFSLREARRLGDDHIGSEHVLLGVISEADGMAAQILMTKVPLRVLRERLLEELTRAA